MIQTKIYKNKLELEQKQIAKIYVLLSDNSIYKDSKKLFRITHSKTCIFISRKLPIYLEKKNNR